MPSVDRDGASIHYTTAGPSDAPAVVFLGDLGFGAWQWSWQYDAVAGLYRAVVVDTRGCGRSDAPADAYEMSDFVDDLDAVMADQNLRKAHLVGCGLGGCVALAAAHRTNRARSLTLLGTPATGAQFDPDDLRADPTDDDALRASTTALLSDEFAASDDAPIQQIVEWRRDEDAPQPVQSAQAGAIADFYPDPLYEVTLPSLVIAGGRDSVVPVESAETLADELPRGEFREFPEAGHLVTVERSAAVNDELVGFLESVSEP